MSNENEKRESHTVGSALIERLGDDPEQPGYDIWITKDGSTISLNRAGQCDLYAGRTNVWGWVPGDYDSDS